MTTALREDELRRDRCAADARRGRRPRGPFPDSSRVPAEHDRRGASRRRHLVHHPPRRDARPGRRVRLRQEHDRAGAHPPPRQHRRHRQVRWDRSRVAEIRSAAQDAPPDADHLPGPVRIVGPAHDRRRHDRRTDRHPRSGVRSGEARADRRSPADRRTGPQVRLALPTRVLGRPAAAHRDRACSRGRARIHRVRRADLAPSTCRSRRRSSTC